MPEYMATHDSDSIFNPRQSPFSWGNNAEGTTFYEFLLSHPDRLKRFNVAMTTQEGALPVLGMFPFTSLLEKDADPSRAFIVDVAGGRGHGVEKMVIDFFTPQPVKSEHFFTCIDCTC
jgi:hypothetical protein